MTKVEEEQLGAFDGRYSAKDMAVLEGLGAGPEASGHVHRVDGALGAAPPRMGGRRQLGR